jgi:pSer/pThr/pTyr-binding forkhead associated (FHA) protein
MPMNSSKIKFTERDLIVGLAALIGGIISTIVVALPLNLFLPSAVLAGIVEEPAKVIGLLVIVRVLPEWLTSKTKCALFGGLAGLGFAFSENLLYYLGIYTEEELAFGIVGRTFLCIPSHILGSAIVGMGLLYVAAKGKEGYKKAGEFLLIAIVLHGLWNAFGGLILILDIAVFGYIYKKTEEYPVPPEQIGILRISPTKREIVVTRSVRTFGRADFEKDVSDDRKLLLISRNHFVIARKGNTFYLEDANSASGTKLNGIEIKGKGMQELNARSEIALPGDITIEFTTKAAKDAIEGGITYREMPKVDAALMQKKIAKLILPNNEEIEIREGERTFGREDFRGVVSDEDLQHISRKHITITRANGMFFIEDEGSLNGTKLNGAEIKGLGRRKLENGDEIVVGTVLEIRYVH